MCVCVCVLIIVSMDKILCSINTLIIIISLNDAVQCVFDWPRILLHHAPVV